MACLRRRGSSVGLQLSLMCTLAHGKTVPPVHMIFGAANIPHPEKAEKYGEDAYFFDDHTGAFALADGVGGSASKDVDPGLFSREMLRTCHSAAARKCEGSLQAVLEEAAAQELLLGGSATLLLGRLQSDSLCLLNLGDSGAMVLRPSFRKFRSGNFFWPRVVLRSQDQTHYFNCPYQVAAEDFDSVATRVDRVSVDVQEGDILVAATDGVLDNLFDKQIQIAVAQALPQLRSEVPEEAQAAVDDLAASIARMAHEMGLRQDEEGLHTPFAVAAAEEGYRFDGGKLDDVAIVCGLVRSGTRPPIRIGHNFEGATALCEADGAQVHQAATAVDEGPVADDKK